jgi:hypothetical protein
MIKTLNMEHVEPTIDTSSSVETCEHIESVVENNGHVSIPSRRRDCRDIEERPCVRTKVVGMQIIAPLLTIIPTENLS